MATHQHINIHNEAGEAVQALAPLIVSASHYSLSCSDCYANTSPRTALQNFQSQSLK